MKKEGKRSLTEARINSKPATIAPSPRLFRLSDGTLVWDVLGTSPDAEEIPARSAEDQERYRIHYAFVGGKRHHCVKIDVEDITQGPHDIRWIYVRSYTGGQIRFIKEGQAPEVLFAMAEDDAYMFCQNDPCIECAFACKVGFEFFAYSASEGLIKDAAKIIYSR